MSLMRPRVMVWQELRPLVCRVAKDHRRYGLVGHGHDMLHAVRVAQLAHDLLLEAGHWQRAALLAAAAGICHNADRVLQKQLGFGRREVPAQAIETLVERWLVHFPGLSRDGSDSRREVVRAVIEHSGPNCEGDSDIKIALQDADRLVNSALDTPLRSGQFYPDLPCVDLDYLSSGRKPNYEHPTSVLEDIELALEWLDPARGKPEFMVRLPGAKHRASALLLDLLHLCGRIRRLHQEAGLVPLTPDLRAALCLDD